MPRKPSIQILAENIDRLMELSPNLKNNVAVAKAAGTTHSHVRRIRRQEAAATVEMLDKLAVAFGMHAYEFLIDNSEIRKAVIDRALGAWGEETRRSGKR